MNLNIRNDIYRNNKLVYKGWQLDYKKFRIYLRDKYKVTKAFLFIGYLEGNKKLYQFLKRVDYKLVFKPTIKDNSGKPKGNVDAELVLHSAAIEYSNYNKAIIVSGDGDFYCLYKYLVEGNKLGRILIPNKVSFSRLLWEFSSNTDFLHLLKKKLKK